MKFEELITRVRKQQGYPAFKGRIFILDPGMTTGWAFFHGLQLINQGELVTAKPDSGAIAISRLITQHEISPEVLVIEDYRVFHSRAKHHAGSRLHTSQLIGGIKTIAAQNYIPVFLQQPSQAKAFVTDEKLKEWGFYVRGHKHARDAIRHGCYFLVFNKTWKEKINAQRISEEAQSHGKTSKKATSKSHHVG